MAISAAAVWRVRADGADTNGAGYDATISGAGTDYSDQAAAQLTVTDGATSGAGSTTLTSVTGGFTTAMIGNAIRIASGTNFTTGYYFITGRTDTNTVTLDRSPTPGGAGSNGAVKVGGAAATIKKVFDSANATDEKCIAGNTVYVRGGGTDTPGAADYPDITGYYTPVVGSTANGRTKLIGYNGRPRFRSNGLMLYNVDFNHFENLYLTCSSNTFGTLGIIYAIATVGASEIVNCVADLNNQTAMVAYSLYGGAVVGGEIKGGRSATSAGGYGVESRAGVVVVAGVNIHETGDRGVTISTNSYASVVGNRIYKCYGDSVYITSGTAGCSYEIARNTIDAGAGHGVYLADALSVAQTQVYGNQITNHTTAAKKGINCAAGSTALNDRLKGFIDYNNVYGNNGNYGNISAGAHDTTQDPGYVAASSGDHTPAASEDSLGYPAQLLNATGSINYVAKGAIQRLVAGGLPPRIMQIHGGNRSEY